MRGRGVGGAWWWIVLSSLVVAAVFGSVVAADFSLFLVATFFCLVSCLASSPSDC